MTSTRSETSTNAQTMQSVISVGTFENLCLCCHSGLDQACPVLDTGESSSDFLDSRWSLPRTLIRGGNDIVRNLLCRHV